MKAPLWESSCDITITEGWAKTQADRSKQDEIYGLAYEMVFPRIILMGTNTSLQSYDKTRLDPNESKKWLPQRRLDWTCPQPRRLIPFSMLRT